MASLTRSPRIVRLAVLLGLLCCVFIVLRICDESPKYTSNAVETGKPLVFEVTGTSYSALATIAWAVLATITVEGLVLVVDSAVQWRRVTQFKKFYSIENDERVFLVLPRFEFSGKNLDSTVARQPAQEFKRLTNSLKNTSGAFNACAAFGDIRSAAAIAESFHRDSVQSPALIADTDDDAVKLIRTINGSDPTLSTPSTRLQRRTFIAIGLDSNDLSVAVTDCLLKGTLEVSTRPGEVRLQPFAKPPYTASELDKDWDYAIIARVTYRETTTIFIVAGTKETGTERAGCYLRDNWRHLKKTPSSSADRTLIENRDFYQLVQVALDGAYDTATFTHVRGPKVGPSDSSPSLPG